VQDVGPLLDEPEPEEAEGSVEVVPLSPPQPNAAAYIASEIDNTMVRDTVPPPMLVSQIRNAVKIFIARDGK
jgi:hypothetical protein